MIVDFLTLILITLISYRVTRLVVDDSLIGTGPHSGTQLSERVDKWGYFQEDDEEVVNGDKLDGEGRTFIRGKITDLITCPFCLSYWFSNAVLALWTWSTPWNSQEPRLWVLTGFAISGAVALIYEYINKETTVNVLGK